MRTWTWRDRHVLLRRRDPVDCNFEVVRIEDEGSILLNLIDDLEYRVHSNTGQTMVDVRTTSPLSGHAWCLSRKTPVSGGRSAPPAAEPGPPTGLTGEARHRDRRPCLAELRMLQQLRNRRRRVRRHPRRTRRFQHDRLHR